MDTTERITPKQADTYAQDNKTVHAPEGTYAAGAIADLDTARRMATFEDAGHTPVSKELDKQLGEKAAEKIGLEAEVDASGLTEIQKKMVEQIKGIGERHPGVLKEIIEGNERFWQIKSANPDDEFMFFSVDGVYFLKREKMGSLSEVSLSEASKVLERGKRRIISGEISKDPKAEKNLGFMLGGLKIKLNDEDEKKWLARALKIGDTIVKNEEEKKQKVDNYSELLNDL